MSSFYNKYIKRRKNSGSVLCVGLDPDQKLIPEDYFTADPMSACIDFISDIIQATADLACAYKPNLAFFEAMGPNAFAILKKTIELIHKHAPGTLIILDAKRGDIGNTAGFYAKALFEDLGGDAVTLSPYMGQDTLDPFLKYDDKAVIVLCNTSNDGSAWLQEYGNPPLYLKLASDMQNHVRKNQIWLVVGATKSTTNLADIRRVAPDLPFLVPGVGAQGGTVANVMQACGSNVLINVGRSILYATHHRSEVPLFARQAAADFVDQMQPWLT